MPKKRIICEAVLDIEYSDDVPEREVLKLAREELKSKGREEIGGGYSFLLKSVKVPLRSSK